MDTAIIRDALLHVRPIATSVLFLLFTLQCVMQEHGDGPDVVTGPALDNDVDMAGTDGPPPPVQVGDHIEYVADRIIGHRMHWDNGRSIRQYLVSWMGYPAEENTWEPIPHLENSQELMDEYECRVHPTF